MTDRELLELAAKAAGYELEWREWITSRVGKFQTIKHTKHDGFWLEGKSWNPLTDDGDALRLAVKLGIDIENSIGANCHASFWSDKVDDYVHTDEAHKSDANAATRLAIVRAAAEIGKKE